MTDKEIILPSSWGMMRYSKKPFPSYRFVPGYNFHPSEHPLGHSFKKPEESIVSLKSDYWYTNEQYLYGVDLYNYCFWWEAHEAWEGLWGETNKGDVPSNFLQGLIQISAAFLKWHLREERGVRSLFESGYGYLKKVHQHEPLYMGLDLTKHLKKLETHFVLDNLKQWPSPLAHYPFIVLEDFPQ